MSSALAIDKEVRHLDWGYRKENISANISRHRRELPVICVGFCISDATTARKNRLSTYPDGAVLWWTYRRSVIHWFSLEGASEFQVNQPMGITGRIAYGI